MDISLPHPLRASAIANSLPSGLRAWFSVANINKYFDLHQLFKENFIKYFLKGRILQIDEDVYFTKIVVAKEGVFNRKTTIFKKNRFIFAFCLGVSMIIIEIYLTLQPSSFDNLDNVVSMRALNILLI